jgi:hypothetical protein
VAAVVVTGAASAGGCGAGGGADAASRAPRARSADFRNASAGARASALRRAVVWAVGDGAASGSAAGRVAHRIAASRVDRFLYLGDVYEQGTAAEFARYYAPVFGRFSAVTIPTPGNHEWDNRAQGYNAYWRRVRGRTPPRWSASSIAGWQLLDLNSEAEHGATSAQVRWLRRTVRGGGNCRIAFWHRPRYSAGLHGDQPDVQPLWAALVGRARLVLNGHDHDMQRFAPRRGITELISGAGGHGHYGLHAHAGLRFGDATHFGALRLVLRPGRADWAFVAENGRKLDAGRLSCRRR